MYDLSNDEKTEETLEEQMEDILKLFGDTKELCLAGEDCDEISGSYGSFGLVSTNPIPVNGSMGEIKYLNRLRKARGFIYHRLGSVSSKISKNILDAYEIVSFDGQDWDILYFDIYHPRRSTRIPEGYIFSENNNIIDRLPFGFGINSFDSEFPFSIPTFIDNSSLIKKYMPPSIISDRVKRMVEDKEKFIRPKDHKKKVEEIIGPLF
jgi:hypothetical protein